MNRIRYFGFLVDPARYRKSGWKGRLLQIVNGIRLWLEQWSALLVLRIESEQSGLSKDEVKRTLEEAKKDPRFDPSEHHPVAMRSRTTIRDLLDEANGTRDEKTFSRYGAGRKNADGEAPSRPVALDEGMAVTFSFFEKRHDRSARYVGGRGTRVVCEPGEYDGTQEDRAAADRSATLRSSDAATVARRDKKATNAR